MEWPSCRSPKSDLRPTTPRPGAREDVTSSESVGDHQGLDLERSFGPSHAEGPRHRFGDAQLDERRRGGAPEPLRLGHSSLHVAFLHFLWIGGARARREPGGRPRRERPGTAKRARDRETSSRRVSGRDSQDVSLTAYPIWKAGGRGAHRGSGRSRFRCRIAEHSHRSLPGASRNAVIAR